MTEIIKDPVWVLKIHSFKGVSFGAMHYYGSIKRDIYALHPDREDTYWCSTESIEVQHVLTPKEAAALNEKDSTVGLFGSYDMDSGEWSQRFDREKDVEASAIAIWAKYAAKGESLVVENMFSDGNRLLAKACTGDPLPEFQPRRTSSGGSNPLEPISHYDWATKKDENGVWIAIQEDK